MNLTEMRTETQRHIGQLSNGYVTPTIIDGAINARARNMNSEACINRADVTIGLQTGVYEYTVPSVVNYIYSVRYGSAKTKLDPTDRYTLDRTTSDWESATAGTPTKYWTDGNLLGVYPKPGSISAGTLIYVRAVKDPPTLSTGTNTPNWCPRRFHQTIAKGAAIDILGGFAAENQGSAERLQTLYSEYLAEMRELTGMLGRRSLESKSTIAPTGYETFSRRSR